MRHCISITISLDRTHCLGNTTLILCLVVVARLIRYSSFVSILIHPKLSAPLTATSVPTVNNILDRKIRRRPGPVAFYVDAVSQSTGGTARPARPAIYNQMYDICLNCWV